MTERPPILTFTDAATARLAELAAAGQGKPLRLSLKNAGCAGMAYQLDYAAEENPAGIPVDTKDVRLLIAPEALMFVLGTEIDYRVSAMESGFVFNNPNQTDACGCGESVLLQEAKLLPSRDDDRLSS